MIQAPLSEQAGHVGQLCTQLGLGRPTAGPQQVFGGFHHRMWRLETDEGVYAIKQLSGELYLDDPETLAHYNATEAVAAAFARKGIPALHALPCGPRYLHCIERDGYLVYPWTEAVAIDRKNLSETHALEVAAILARMHGADVRVSGLRETRAELHPEAKIIDLVKRSVACNARDYRILEDHLPSFLSIAACQGEALRILGEHQLISHGDLDQKNVLWNSQGEAVLIDWESARALNPTYEIILVALDWSGITSAFETVLFEKIIGAYRHSGGIMEKHSVVAALQCIQGDWLNWLMFNVGRSVELDDENARDIGSEQVDLALSTLMRLERLMPRLLAGVEGAGERREVVGDV